MRSDGSFPLRSQGILPPHEEAPGIIKGVQENETGRTKMANLNDIPWALSLLSGCSCSLRCGWPSSNRFQLLPRDVNLCGAWLSSAQQFPHQDLSKFYLVHIHSLFQKLNIISIDCRSFPLYCVFGLPSCLSDESEDIHRKGSFLHLSWFWRLIKGTCFKNQKIHGSKNLDATD